MLSSGSESLGSFLGLLKSTAVDLKERSIGWSCSMATPPAAGECRIESPPLRFCHVDVIPGGTGRMFKAGINVPLLGEKLGVDDPLLNGEVGKLIDTAEDFLFLVSFEEEFLMACNRTSFSLHGEDADRNMLRPLVLRELLSSSGSADDAPESDGDTLCLVTSSVNGFFSLCL